MINWGILGFGRMGATFANAIKETSNSKLINIASKTGKTLTNFENKTYEDLINNNDIDAMRKAGNLASKVLDFIEPYVKEGATTLKQTFALVYSDARALAIPSKADLEAPMLAWNGKPIFAATLDINTTLAPSASLSLLITFFTTLDAPRTLILKSFIQ